MYLPRSVSAHSPFTYISNQRTITNIRSHLPNQRDLFLRLPQSATWCCLHRPFCLNTFIFYEGQFLSIFFLFSLAAWNVQKKNLVKTRYECGSRAWKNNGKELYGEKNDQTYIAHAFIVRMFFYWLRIEKILSSFFGFHFFVFTEKI